MLPDDDIPGIEAALEIQKQLPLLKILKPIPAARKIKSKGADIVEILQVMSVEEIERYILNSEPYKIIEIEPPDIEEKKNDTVEKPGQREIPFRILGIADDQNAYFLDRHERLYVFPPDSISRNKLLKLAPLSFWKSEFYLGHRILWDDCCDFIIETSGRKDFDVENLRGRGAWREPDGKICYHDGKNTIGEFNGKYIFLKKNRVDIGLNDEVADRNICQEIAQTVNKMSFESKIDTIRLISWAALAPFAGALPWRPAILVTGPSGSGKTTIVDYVLKKIAKPHVFSGGETTPAFIRQFINRDSSAVVLEEMDRDTEKKRKNIADIFSLMRQSTSDEAPLVGKGSKDGKPVFFNMTNMFAFIAVSPEVDSVADDKRIFRINITLPKTPWKPIREKLKELLTKKNCRAIRALTWGKFNKILSLADNLTEVIRDVTGKDTRSSFAEGLLFAAYFLIWQGREDISNEDARILLRDIFGDAKEVETARHDEIEVLDRLLDESVFLPDKSMMTLRQILYKILYGDLGLNDSDDYTKTAERYGLKIDSSGYIYIAINHHEIMKIIERGRGYQRLLWRHPMCVERHVKRRIADKTRGCVKLSGILEKENVKKVENKEGKKLFPVVDDEGIPF